MSDSEISPASKTSDVERLVMRLAVALANYEMDEPHTESPDCEASDCYGTLTYENLLEGSKMKHHGDCVKIAGTCFRCYADHILHKAQWMADRAIDV